MTNPRSPVNPPGISTRPDDRHFHAYPVFVLYYRIVGSVTTDKNLSTTMTSTSALPSQVVGSDIPTVAGPSSPVEGGRKKNGVVARHHLASGAFSGFTSAVILQPLDLVKTRLQQSYEGDGVKRYVGSHLIAPPSVTEAE